MGTRRTPRRPMHGDMEWLQRTIVSMVRCRTVASLLDLAYDSIRQGLGYDRVGLFLVDSCRGLVQYVGTDENGREFHPSDRVWPLDADSYHARLLSDPRMSADGPGFVYLADAAHELPEEVRPGLDGQPSRNLQVALRTPERVVGLISADNLTSGRPIASEDAPPLVAFANALATAVENVTMLESRAHLIENLDADLRRRVLELEELRTRERDEHLAAEVARRRLTFLAEASALLATSLDYAETMRRVARLAVAHLADWCTVDVVDEQGAFDQVAVAHEDPAGEQMVAEVRRRYPPSPTGGHALMQVIRGGRPLVAPVVTDDWLKANTRGEEHFRVMRAIGLRSYMCVPLIARERTLGAITFLSAAADRGYDADDLALAEDLARRAAMAVDNARLYQVAQEARLTAEAAVRMRDEFLSVTSHDLRSPLTNILGRADLVDMKLSRGAPLDAAWVRAQIDAVRGATRRMLATVQEITDTVQLQFGQTLALRAEALDVGALVRAVAAESADRQDAIPLVVEAPDGLAMQGDRARLERVVQNLVDNALKYSTGGTPVHVSVSRQEAWIAITVRDSGVGIPADELPRVFTPFYRASTAIGIRGTGIGLAGAKAIVEQHGGRIEIQSAAGQGTTVTVRLPAASGDQ